MPIRTVKKNKSTKTCKGCGGNVAGSASKCQNCGSTDLAKVLVRIRKSEATGDDAGLSDADLETASDLSESEDVEDVEDEDDIEDLEEDDFEPADDDDESDEDEEDDDEEEEDDDESEEESDEDEEEEPEVTKRVVRRNRVAKRASDEIQVDITLAALALASDVSKTLDDEESYEDVMTEFNNLMDAIQENGADGNSIAKEDKAAKLKRLKARLAELRGMLKNGGGDDEDVEKSDDGDIYAGLTPQAAEIVRKSQELIEKNTSEQFETIAKSYGALPTTTSDLGAALRFLSENDDAAYATITKALAGASEAVNQSDIFKSFGSVQTGEETGQTIEAVAKSFQEKDSNLSHEQAMVKAMTERPDLYQQALSGNR